MPTAAPTACEMTLEHSSGGSLVIRLAGPWLLESGLPSAEGVEREVEARRPSRIAFDTTDLGPWDTGILAFVVAVSTLGRRRSVDVDVTGLPEGLQRLLALAEAVPVKKDAASRVQQSQLVELLGEKAIETHSLFLDDLDFLGRLVTALGRLARGRARFRGSELALLIQQSGFDALPIVTLVTFLLGLILAFVGAVQLQTFGATIYVADLVGVAMVRDMGALITGIIMAGRSGAAFAAQIGSMKVTQETDALTTMAISPIEFLVVPRVLALSLMMPLLTVYGDAMGILGGGFVGLTMLSLSPLEYYQQTIAALSLGDLAGGIFKGSVYGVLIAVAGCLRGMQAGKSSSAVGEAATSAVVTGIVLIIVACGVFAYVFYVLGL